MAIKNASISLHGLWEPIYYDFIWQAAKIFHKSGSNHIHDYWISYASGACLASSAHSVAGRYDPDTNFLTFSRSGNSVVDGPWKLLTQLNHSDANPSSLSMVFFTQEGLKALQQKMPILYESAWKDPLANEELLRFAMNPERSSFGVFGILQWKIEKEESVGKDETLPHGSLWGVSYLKSIDENENRRDRLLQVMNRGRQITSGEFR